MRAPGEAWRRAAAMLTYWPQPAGDTMTAGGGPEAVADTDRCAMGGSVGRGAAAPVLLALCPLTCCNAAARAAASGKRSAAAKAVACVMTCTRAAGTAGASVSARGNSA